MIFAVSGVFGQNVFDNLVIKEVWFIPHGLTWSCVGNNARKKVKVFTIVNTIKSDTNYLYQRVPRKRIFKLLQDKPVLIIPQTVRTIPQNFYTQNFGFFCKKELQLQKAIKVPFVFRLGSVEMCDRLEGK